MEKCTYCVQRINRGQDRRPRSEDRPIRDGEIVTACQAACPTQAIVFGNINDPKSKVARLKVEPHELWAAGGVEHAAAYDVSGRDCAIRTPRSDRDTEEAASTEMAASAT